MQRPLLLLLLACAIALSPAAQARRRHATTLVQDTAPFAGDALVDPDAKERALAELGRFVALAPRCGLRDDGWGQRLDVALLDAMQDIAQQAGEKADDAALLLTSVEFRAVTAWKANAARACAALRARPPGELHKADELAGTGVAPG